MVAAPEGIDALVIAALLSFGSDAEVLAPEEFRNCFAEESEILNNIYNS